MRKFIKQARSSASTLWKMYSSRWMVDSIRLWTKAFLILHVQKYSFLWIKGLKILGMVKKLITFER